MGHQSQGADHPLPLDLPAGVLLDAAPDAIVIVDDHGRIMGINTQAERLFGYPRADLAGQPVEVLLPEQFQTSHRAHRATYEAAPRTRPMGIGLELLGRRQDGSVFPAEISLSPLQTSQGRVVLSIIRDLSARKQVEAALQASEQRFRALFNQTFEFIGLLTSAGVVLEANETALDFVGVPIEAVRGRPFWDTPWWTSAEDQARLRAAVATAARGEVVRFEAVHVGTEGQAMTVDFSVKPVLDEAGQVTLLLAEGRDITARKQVEQERDALLAKAQEARVAAERLQLISDTALTHLSLDALLAELLTRLVQVLGVETGVIFLLDPEEQVLWPRATTGLEGDITEQVAIPVGRYFIGRVADQQRLLMAADINPEDIASPIVRTKGIRSVIGTPLLVSGRLIGVLRLGTGLRRQFSEDDAKLVRLAADRAAMAIEHALLYQQAQDAVQARETFLSTASHELKTPLTTVKGWVHLLARALRDPEGVNPASIAEFAEELQSQVDRLERLINDLLDISRIQQGRLELELEPVNLSSLARRTLERFDHAPERTPAHVLRYEGPPQVIGLWDEQRLDQVLTNLISNAVKYSPQGGEVCLTLEADEAEVLITVTDQGIGVDEDDLAGLFEPFRRTDAARRSASGTGLGLSITRRIIEQHGGTITLASAAGSGTQVKVSLPRTAGDPSSAEDQREHKGLNPT